MPSELSTKHCIPCRGGIPPLKGKELEQMKKKIGGNWSITNEHHLEKEFTFKDFKGAWDFTNRIGRIAEEEGHHPDIYLAWGKVKLTIWTHKIDGLTESDFILAAKVDTLSRE